MTDSFEQYRHEMTKKLAYELQRSLDIVHVMGPREKPRFSEILVLKSLRKGWENETEQWQILIQFRLPKLTPETRTHRVRWGLRQCGGG